MRMVFFLCLAACGSSSQPAAPDAPVVNVIGDFSCAGVPWPATAPDPLIVAGGITDDAGVFLAGAAIEIHAGDGALLAQATTSSGPLMSAKGKYSLNLPTGGAAPTIYRKASAAGYLDRYAFDAFPVFESYTVTEKVLTQAGSDALYQAAGVTADPSKGSLYVELYDCNLPPHASSPGPGITIEGPADAHVVYFDDNGQPDPSLTATSSYAGALILGATAGTVDIAVHAGAITYRPWPVQVFAGAWTTSLRHP